MTAALLASIVEGSDDAIISKSLDGTVTSWNAGATALFGYTAPEMLGQSIRRLLPPDRGHEEDLILQRIQRGERVDHFETVRLHRSGRLVQVSVTISPLRDASGRIVGASKIARDIGERLERHALLAQFRAIVTGSNDAILSKDLNGIVQSWNPACVRLFGHASAEMIGRSIECLLPPDRWHEERNILDKIRAGERIEHFETQRLRKDGSLVDVSVTVSPLFDARGQVVGASKIVRDITERRRADQRMRLMDSVFSHTSEAIVVTDDGGRLIEVNEAFTHITGYQRHEVLGQDPSLFRSGRQGPEVYKSMLASLQASGHCQGEVWSRRKTGEAYAVMLTVSAVPSPDGGPAKYVGLFSDITSLREQQEKMERVASFDPLTQLPNRLLLADRLERAMAHALRENQALAVAYLDLDGFKAVNDAHGHDVGDELLVTLSARLQAAIRETDTVARIGGDEFVAVLLNAGSAEQCADRLHTILSACQQPMALNGHAVAVSASMGVTLYPHDDSEADKLLRHADQAMFQAKQLGKNRFQFFDPNRDAEVKQRHARLTEFARALQNQELVLHFQPKVDLRSGQVLGAEALIRWQHPVRGLLPPSEFLPLIESHPLSHAVGEWVIQKALHQLATWNAAQLPLRLSINIAPEHLKSSDFAAKLLAELELHPTVSPDQLELEIVESSDIGDTTPVERVIASCRQRGVRFSLDDFGTGYSSLIYLKQLRVDTVKIDRSFVRDMLDDQDDLAIVKGVIGLAQAFNRSVVAEGVETRDHARQLLNLGCDWAQGYGIARPMPAEALSGWTAQWQQGAHWAFWADTPKPDDVTR